MSDIPAAALTYKADALIVPVFTPFNDDGSLNLDIIPGYAKYLEKNNVRSILVNGTSGEGMSMSVEERKRVAEAWVNAIKKTRFSLMIQVGGAPLPDVIELAKHANSLDVSDICSYSILCLPDLYFKPTTEEELIEYLQIVAKAAPNTPLLYYHIPMFTNVNIRMDKFLKSVDGKIPSFVGIKFTSDNLTEAIQAYNSFDLVRKYTVSLGNDYLIGAACALGMDSFTAISGNLFPGCIQHIIRMIKHYPTDSSKRQKDLSSTINAILQYGNLIPAMKTAMSAFTDINVGPPRAPLKPLSPEISAQIVKELLALGHNSKKTNK